MKKKTKIITMAEIAIFASIGFILDLLAGLYSGFFVNGGSISFAMIAVIIVGYRRGSIAGVCCVPNLKKKSSGKMKSIIIGNIIVSSPSRALHPKIVPSTMK
jgi:thiamine transporter ThiT